MSLERPRNDRPEGKMNPWSLWQQKKGIKGELISIHDENGDNVIVPEGVTDFIIMKGEDGGRTICFVDKNQNIIEIAARYDLQGKRLG